MPNDLCLNACHCLPFILLLLLLLFSLSFRTLTSSKLNSKWNFKEWDWNLWSITKQTNSNLWKTRLHTNTHTHKVARLLFAAHKTYCWPTCALGPLTNKAEVDQQVVFSSLANYLAISLSIYLACFKEVKRAMEAAVVMAAVVVAEC